MKKTKTTAQQKIYAEPQNGEEPYLSAQTSQRIFNAAKLNLCADEVTIEFFKTFNRQKHKL